MRFRAVVLVAAAMSCGAAQDNRQNAGAGTCARCHKLQFDSQSQSGHARALFRALEHPLAARFVSDRPLSRPPDYEFRFEREHGRLQVSVRQRDRQIMNWAEWAFGSGTHGVTFVGRSGPDAWLEHAFTYYSDNGSFDITPGQRVKSASTLEEAAGQVLRIQGAMGIRACFACHSTGAADVSPSGRIVPEEAGVRCEACHGPGRSHVEAALRNDVQRIRAAIRNPGKLSGSALNELCGRCHRPPGAGDAGNDFTNPWNVRHQPPYFEQSKCFQASNGKLSCISCHAPHAPIRRNDSQWYSSKCNGCHAGPNAVVTRPAAICLSGDQRDCTVCHMPAVRVDPHLSFRNHWIGVYRTGQPLIPSR